jgi:predicted DNA-binding transcriptional regulator AlpA
MTETYPRINITEAAYICGRSVQTIRNWMRLKNFPKPDENKLFDHLAVLEWASLNAIRTARIVRR